MYAVIETGGKQYRVQPGDVIDVELLSRDGAAQDRIEFDRVLMVAGEGDLKVGAPVVEGAAVHGTRVGDVRGRKVLVFKVKKRKHFRRKTGHRQNYVRVRIDEIQPG